ncbi:MAG: alpha-2-macroglobulin family protein, partial [Lentisphaeria bacterium]|nr:alpha-2-macroglobulin family protein [Lentisphaeria bacterium]
YTVTDNKGNEIEGAHVFVVRGAGFDGGNYRFSHIELVPDKTEYRPGEKVELMIRTDRPDSTVLLFVRPTNGVYLPPQLLRLRGQTTTVTLEVSKKDMPNFFVEAMTIAEGKLHTDIREIVVPPESRVLEVEVTPGRERYKPGEQGQARIRLTDAQGKPFVGSIVVSVYDKSVEYIAGGSNVGDIKSFFWKWRRQHNESTLSNLGRWFVHLARQGERVMGNLGVFGHLLADDMVDYDGDGTAMAGGGGGVDMYWSRGRVDVSVDGRMASGSAMLMEGNALPAAPMQPMGGYMVFDSLASADKAEAAGAPEAATPEVTVRTNFADTALWISARETDADGVATIDLPMPESLTTWKIRVWALGHGTKVGEGSAEVITAKDLMVRLQAPRFFVETDEVVLSANIHSYVDRARTVEAILELDGPCLEPLDETKRRVSIEPNGELRVDWRVKAVAEGEAVVRMKAIAADDADALEMRFPVFVHGMDKMDSFCGVLRPEQTAGGTVFAIPEARRPETARLEVRYSPTLAMAMTDALPYLIAYPYGCTEQTLNRFLPAVLTQKTLQRLGVSLADIRERRANLNAQEIGDPAARAKQWQRYKTEAVWDESELAKIVREGVEALASMQLSDGGWGWFSGYGEQSYPHTTAQVVHGLTVAAQNDVAVPPETIARGVEWLKRYEAEQVQLIRNSEQDPMVRPWKAHADHLDALVYWVLSEHDQLNPAMRDYLYRDRNHLAVYAKGLFGLALHLQKQTEMRDMVIRNLRQFLKTDDENQTAYLEMGNDGYWWWWYGDEIEAHAVFLRLLAATEPKGDTAHRLVKYLLNNRKHATYWQSTRDTAACIEAFADYLRASGEDRPDQTIQVVLDGRVVKEVKVDATNLFSFDNTFVLAGEALAGGEHRLELRKQGTGPLYWNAYASYFTLEDFIPA